MIINIGEGKRPACAYCGKPLRIYTRIIWAAPKGSVPTTYHNNFANTADRENLPVLKVVRRRPCRFDDTKEDITVWCGEYDTTMQYFCKGPCCDEFALAAYKAGYRMKEKA